MAVNKVHRWGREIERERERELKQKAVKQWEEIKVGGVSWRSAPFSWRNPFSMSLFLVYIFLSLCLFFSFPKSFYFCLSFSVTLLLCVSISLCIVFSVFLFLCVFLFLSFFLCLSLCIVPWISLSWSLSFSVSLFLYVYFPESLFPSLFLSLCLSFSMSTLYTIRSTSQYLHSSFLLWYEKQVRTVGPEYYTFTRLNLKNTIRWMDITKNS